MNLELLQKLCSIHGPSGDEIAIKNFLLEHAKSHQHEWKIVPTILEGHGFQDCMIWIFGKPRTAIFAHIDTVGFTVAYDNRVVPIGSPAAKTGDIFTGIVDDKPVEAPYLEEMDCITSLQTLPRGTTLTYKPNFRIEDDLIISPYLDNRLGVYNALMQAETLENGAIVFGTYEEHRGGMVGYLADLLFRDYGVHQALISDITWVTDGVRAGQGVAISLRDSFIPRRTYLNKIVQIAEKTQIPYQLEVESEGGSDGSEIQRSAIPMDWCFIGAPELYAHTPHEQVHIADIESMVSLYQVLMTEL
jgi:putative aminopeptidase FrvX